MVHEIDGQVCDIRGRTKHFPVLCKLPSQSLLTFNNKALGLGAASEYERSDSHLNIARGRRKRFSVVMTNITLLSVQVKFMILGCISIDKVMFNNRKGI